MLRTKKYKKTQITDLGHFKNITKSSIEELEEHIVKIKIPKKVLHKRKN